VNSSIPEGKAFPTPLVKNNKVVKEEIKQKYKKSNNIVIIKT